MSAPLETVRIRLGYRDLDTFVTRFAPNVTRGGVFLATKSPLRVGDSLRFEISLVEGPVLLSGSGRVTWTRQFDPEKPRQPYGMGVQFIELDPASEPMLEQLLQSRERRASAPPAAPRHSSTKDKDATEFDEHVSEETIERALRYARELADHTGYDDASLEALLGDVNDDKPTPATPSLEEALAGLAEFLRPRTRSGLYRIPSEVLNGKDKPE